MADRKDPFVELKRSILGIANRNIRAGEFITQADLMAHGTASLVRGKWLLQAKDLAGATKDPLHDFYYVDFDKIRLYDMDFKGFTELQESSDPQVATLVLKHDLFIDHFTPPYASKETTMANLTPATTTVQPGIQHMPDGYEQALRLMRGNVSDFDPSFPLFRVKPEGRQSLGQAYLDAFPAHRRQHYNCRACLDFINKFGNLVYIDADGRQHSLLFRKYKQLGNTLFRDVFKKLERRVKRGAVMGLYCPTERVLGTPESNGWTHFHGFLNARRKLYSWQEKNNLEGAWKDADSRTAFFVGRYSEQDYLTAIAYAKNLRNPSKVLPQLEALLDLKRRMPKATTAKMVRNLRAAFAAKTPLFTGRSTVAAQFIENLKKGVMPQQSIDKANAMLNPLACRRPDTVKAGTIREAERLFNTPGMRAALRRRYATLDDVGVSTAWTPRAAREGRQRPSSRPGQVTSSTFGHIQATPPPPKAQVMTPPAAMTKMTWRTLCEDYLQAGSVESIQVNVPQRGPFYAFVTACDLNADRIVKWDKAEARNPLTWFTYMGHSQARQWSLMPGWQDLEAIVHFPNQEGVVFVPKGFKAKGDGAIFFPEFLRSDLHKVRSVLEKHSRGARVSHGGYGPNIGGLAVRPVDDGASVKLRLTLFGGARVDVEVDRWK